LKYEDVDDLVLESQIKMRKDDPESAELDQELLD